VEVTYGLQSLWEQRWNFKQTSGLSTVNSGLISCPFCKTDCRVDLKPYPRRGVAISPTKWKDLGSWPDSDDYLRHTTNNPFPAISSSRAGEVAAAFEEGGDHVFDEFDSLLRAEKEKWLACAPKVGEEQSIEQPQISCDSPKKAENEERERTRPKIFQHRLKRIKKRGSGQNWGFLYEHEEICEKILMILGVAVIFDFLLAFSFNSDEYAAAETEVEKYIMYLKLE